MSHNGIVTSPRGGILILDTSNGHERSLEAVADIASAVGIATGDEHSCALLQLQVGVVDCWGGNDYGQLGAVNIGSQTCKPTGLIAQGCSPAPIQVADLGYVAAIAAGEYQTCAVTTDGRVTCWGDNGYGQLGVGTTTGPQVCRAPDGKAEACSAVPEPVNGIRVS